MRGERELNRVRDEAAAIAVALGHASELRSLRELVSTALSTHDARRVSRVAAAGGGHPLDTRRVELFDVLASHLRSRPLAGVADVAAGDVAVRHFALIEAYFSNYIEGTRFTIEEAIAIGIDGRLPMARPLDAHDLLGVMQVAENRLMRQAVAPVGPAVTGYLEEMHQVVLANRPEADPGKFKLVPNQAGNTSFVLPELARGTLIAGSVRLTEVPDGLARAILALFIVSEVHPFKDGNGRVSRLAMNAELTRAGQCRVIVPTLARDEFFDTLRLMSRSADPKALVDFIVRMQRWTASFRYDDLAFAVSRMALCNAMQENPARFRLLEPM
jgi:Fic family protein